MEKQPNMSNMSPDDNNTFDNHNEEQSTSNVDRKLGETSLLNVNKRMDDFKSFRNNNEVDADARYLEDRKKDFMEKGWLAKQLETISSHGFVDDQWLGNVPGKTGRTPFDVTPVYTAVNSEGTPYDDVVNRIDYAVMMRSNNDDNDNNDGSIIGFDVTINDSALADKLYRTTNDSRSSLPFGFSNLDYGYLPDGTMMHKQTNIPRFCITMSLDEETAKNYNHHYDFLLSQEAKTAKEERVRESQNFLKRFNARARFVVLSEVFEQSKLFRAMLPERNGKDNLIINDAEPKLFNIEKTLWSSLFQAAANYPINTSFQAIISKNQDLQPGDREALDTIASRKRILGNIKKCAESEIDPKEKGRRIFNLKRELYSLVSEYVKTKDSNYAAMIKEVNRLRAMEKDGKLNSLKTIQPRNKKRTN